MTYEEIINLLDRGFTPDQITLLTTSATPTQTEDPKEPEEEENEQPIVDSSSGSTTPPEQNNSEVLEAIADLKKSVQANNIKMMSVETVNPEAELEKAMSELIRPSFEKGE